MRLFPILFLCLAAPGWAADPAERFTDDWKRMADIVPRGYVCYRTDKPVIVDGRLDDPAWAAAPWTEDFIDIEGPVRPRPRFRTRARMTWDERFFYIAAELEEPHVWGTLTQHDAVIFQDNDFEVFIDPDGDAHAYYEFEMNALNTGWDLFLIKPYKDGGPARNDWEIPGLQTAVQIDGTLNHPGDTDRRWTLEIALPWTVLGGNSRQPAPPRNGDQWRVNFSRVQWEIDTTSGAYVKVPGKKEDNWVWSPQGIVDMHRPEQWGYVQFSTRTRGPVAFKPDPTWPARRILQGIYYAQRRFQALHGRAAATLAELGLEAPAPASQVTGIQIRPITDGWEAVAQLATGRGIPRALRIRHDARIEPVRK